MEKFKEQVREVREDTGRILGQESAAGVYQVGRNRWNTAAARRSSVGKIRQPGGVLEGDFLGGGMREEAEGIL